MNEVVYELWLHEPHTLDPTAWADDFEVAEFPPPSDFRREGIDPTNVELVRAEGNDDDGLLFQSYVTLNPDWSLPESFSDGRPIPRRVRQRYKRWLSGK